MHIVTMLAQGLETSGMMGKLVGICFLLIIVVFIFRAIRGKK